MNDTTYIIPNGLVIMILILASIGFGRVAFWCGKFAHTVWHRMLVGRLWSTSTDTMTLGDYLNTREYKGFDPKPRYFRDGDHLTYFIADKRCYSWRINELLTVYTAVDDDCEVVGCKINSISHILEKFGSLTTDSVKMMFFITAVWKLTKEPSTRANVLSMCGRFADGDVPKNILPLEAA